MCGLHAKSYGKYSPVEGISKVSPKDSKSGGGGGKWSGGRAPPPPPPPTPPAPVRAPTTARSSCLTYSDVIPPTQRKNGFIKQKRYLRTHKFK